MTGNAARGWVYPLRVPAWETIPRLVHGFLGRAHSLPPGPFTLGDVRAALAGAGVAATTVYAVRQVHGAEVVALEAAPDATTGASTDDLPAPALEAADAMVSAVPGLALTVRTADCVPILLVAPRARVVAAVHAGWQGTLAGVVARTLATLEERHGVRPADVQAALGPAIDGCCYEFGRAEFDRFVATFGRLSERAWRPRTPTPGRGQDDAAGRGYLDLRLMNRLLLEAAGVPGASIVCVGPCTAEHPAELHSYRRDGSEAGRQLSYVGWRA